MRQAAFPIVCLVLLLAVPHVSAGETRAAGTKLEAQSVERGYVRLGRKLEARPWGGPHALRPLGPKVVVTAVSAPSEPVGDLMQPRITVTIKNIGLTPATDYRIRHQAYVVAYLQEPYPGPHDLGSLQLGIAYLAPGQSLTYSFPVTGIPADWHPMPVAVTIEVFRTPAIRDYGAIWLMSSSGNAGSVWFTLP
ncbi:MAG: hypothetical protein QNJ98_01400 [Planctomycetota bacterium]|nr:hypothetical protein [Planctomycetota bacterium]